MSRPALLPRRSWLLAGLIPAGLALVGCSDGNHTSIRDQPTSAEDSYSLGGRLFRPEDPEVYELPANPPALARGEDDAHRPRAARPRTGQLFKADVLSAKRPEDPKPTKPLGDTTVIGAMGEPIPTPSAPPPGPGVTLVAIRPPDQSGAREALPQGDMVGRRNDERSTAGSGSMTEPPVLLYGVHDE